MVQMVNATCLAQEDCRQEQTQRDLAEDRCADGSNEAYQTGVGSSFWFCRVRKASKEKPEKPEFQTIQETLVSCRIFFLTRGRINDGAANQLCHGKKKKQKIENAESGFCHFLSDPLGYPKMRIER